MLRAGAAAGGSGVEGLAPSIGLAGDTVAIAVEVRAVARLAIPDRRSPRRARRIAVPEIGRDFAPDRLFAPALVESRLLGRARIVLTRHEWQDGIGERQRTDKAGRSDDLRRTLHAQQVILVS